MADPFEELDDDHPRRAGGLFDAPGAHPLAGEIRQVEVVRDLELDLAESDPAAARAQLDAMCARLLANTVIEDYTIDLAE